ncbi:unnamed protein product [Ixodes pacificus]
MSTGAVDKGTQELLEKELYFLISKFLSSGPCKQAGEALKREIEEHHLLPKRIDWLGNEHHRSFSELESSNFHIPNDYLLRICSRIGPLLDQLIPSGVTGSRSLLGSGSYSLLRQQSKVRRLRKTADVAARLHGSPPCFPHGVTAPNVALVLQGRALSGLPNCSQQLSTKFFSKAQLFRRLLGHLSSVYCVLFDRSGHYIFTGADDLLVKIWSACDGRLLVTLRGHSAEITDLAVSPDNRLLASGSCDKVIRVWCLQTLAPVAVLLGHTAMVTSLRFCPYPRGERQFLVSTGNDGCVCFWDYSSSRKSFNSEPAKELTYAQAIEIIQKFYALRANEIAESFKFFTRVQNEVESSQQFIVELQQLADKCNFGDMLDRMLRDKIVCGIRNVYVQRAPLARPKVTLQETENIVLAAEARKQAVKLMKPSDVNWWVSNDGTAKEVQQERMWSIASVRTARQQGTLRDSLHVQKSAK